MAILPPSGPETRAKLKSLRRRHAAVVVWGGRSEHRQVMVTAGSYESMRAEAVASLSAAGLQTIGVWADIAPASAPDDRAARRPVVVSMASASDMSEALQPLRDAGIRLRTVTTPAVALASLTRLGKASWASGAIETYVAFDQRVTCIALVRDGVLLAARDLAWGYLEEDDAHSEVRSRQDVTTRLADAIGGFVAATGGSPKDIGRVCVCGGLPELRSMSTSLMERLSVEVEPLDSLFGTDAAGLPEPADEFRGRSAEMRLAWAAAADWSPAINLLRARRRQFSKAWLPRAAVVAGAAAGLGVGWFAVERSHVWPAPKFVTRPVSKTPAQERGPGPVKPLAPPVVTPAAATVARPPVVTPAAATVARPSVVTPAAATVAVPSVVTPAAATVVRPPAVTPPRAPLARLPVVAPPPTKRDGTPAVTAPRAVVAKPPEVALPFDAVLGTILYSTDRKLALIDNRIVGVGDDVRGARVTEITPVAVLLRDPQGRLRRLRIGAGGR